MRINLVFAAMLTLSITAFHSASADSIDAGAGVDHIAVLPGDTIEIHGMYGHSEGMESCALMVKRTVLSSHIPTSGVDRYDFTYTVPDNTGFSTLDVVYASSSQPFVLARKVDIEIVSSAPLVLGPIPPATYTDVACKPSKVDPSVVSIQGYLDSQDPVTTQPGQSITLPIDKTDSGTHSFYAQSVDDQGYSFRTPMSIFSLPTRIRVAIAPNVIFNKIGQLVPVSVTFIPGVVPASVNYIVSDDILGTATAAPWTAKIPLPGYQTGDYSITATVTTKSGATFKSDSVPFHLINRPADAYKHAEVPARLGNNSSFNPTPIPPTCGNPNPQ